MSILLIEIDESVDYMVGADNDYLQKRSIDKTTKVSDA